MSNASGPAPNAFQQWIGEHAAEVLAAQEMPLLRPIAPNRREQEFEALAARLRGEIIRATHVPRSILMPEEPLRDRMFQRLPELGLPAPMVIVAPEPLAENAVWTPEPRTTFQLADEATTWTNRPASLSPYLAYTAGVFEDCMGPLAAEIAENQRRRFAEAVSQMIFRHERPTGEPMGLLGGTPPPGGYSMSYRVAPPYGLSPLASLCGFLARRQPPDPAAWALQQEYMAWRTAPRVDPAAGPEAHPLQPTLEQNDQFSSWRVMLQGRRDMAGLGFPQHEDGYSAAPTPAAA